MAELFASQPARNTARGNASQHSSNALVEEDLHRIFAGHILIIWSSTIRQRLCCIALCFEDLIRAMVRIKHRYILVNILYPQDQTHTFSGHAPGSADIPWSVRFRRPTADNIDAKSLVVLVRKGVEELFGDYGMGMIASSLVVKYFSPATGTAIIRVARAHYRLVWAALCLATKLPNGQACVFQVARVSGTIRKAEEAAIRQARRAILAAQRDPQQQLAHQPKIPLAGLRIDRNQMISGIEDDDSDIDEVSND